MEYLTLGRSGIRVSRVGFGCAAIGGYDYGPVDDGDSISAIHRALDSGIILFDTAAVYGLGRAEEVLGRALGDRRRDAVIATKFGVEWDEHGRTRRDASPKRIEEALDRSLTRLKTDWIDLYQLHWPDAQTPIAETMGELQRLQRAGKIRAIGLCNVGPEIVSESQHHARVETIQLPYSLLDQQHERSFLDCRDRFGMGLLSYNALAHGFLSGKYNESSRFEGTDLRARNEGIDGLARGAAERAPLIRATAARYGKTPAQVVLRWVTQRIPDLIALAGAKHAAQVAENAGAVDWQLTAADLAALS